MVSMLTALISPVPAASDVSAEMADESVWLCCNIIYLRCYIIVTNYLGGAK